MKFSANDISIMKEIKIEELCKVLNITIEEFNDYCSNRQEMLVREFRKWKRNK
ncbi:MAG: hypothetical protein LBR15_01470 [Methanobrevibacter sp.]|nr:hypothetical protein [Candidatus Methanovirga australis]